MPWADPYECDCLDEDVDILTGIATCDACGRSRWLTSEQLRERLKLEAELQAEYDRQCAEWEKEEATALRSAPPRLTVVEDDDIPF